MERCSRGSESPSLPSRTVRAQEEEEDVRRRKLLAIRRKDNNTFFLDRSGLNLVDFFRTLAILSANFGLADRFKKTVDQLLGRIKRKIQSCPHANLSGRVYITIARQ